MMAPGSLTQEQTWHQPEQPTQEQMQSQMGLPIPQRPQTKDQVDSQLGPGRTLNAGTGRALAGTPNAGTERLWAKTQGT